MSTLFRLFLSFNFLNYHLCQRIPFCVSTLSTLYYLKQFSKWSSHFAFPFYQRCIILNSLTACRASYKCIYHMNSEVKVFAKLSSESGYKGKPSRAGLPLCLRHSPLRSVSKARLSAVCGRRAGTLSHAPCKPLKRLDLNFYYAEGSCVSVLSALYYLKQFSKWSSLMLANP